jgi:hypothetical protein
MFLRMSVMERSLHFATFTIWDVVSLPAVYHMDNDLTPPVMLDVLCNHLAKNLTYVSKRWPSSYRMSSVCLPNNRMFLRMSVMERSLHFATFTIWDVVSLPAVYPTSDHHSCDVGCPL